MESFDLEFERIVEPLGLAPAEGEVEIKEEEDKGGGGGGLGYPERTAGKTNGPSDLPRGSQTRRARQVTLPSGHLLSLAHSGLPFRAFPGSRLGA